MLLHQKFLAKTNEANIQMDDGSSPTTPQEMNYSPMMHNGDTNMVYPGGPPMMPPGPSSYFPSDPNMPMGPPSNMSAPGVLIPPPGARSERFSAPSWGPPPDVRHYRPSYMEPPGGGRRLPPPRFHHGYRDEHAWRSREPWRGQGHRIPGKNEAATTAAAFLIFLYAKIFSVMCFKINIFVSHNFLNFTSYVLDHFLMPFSDIVQHCSARMTKYCAIAGLPCGDGF